MTYIDDTDTKLANLEYIQNAMDEPMLEKEHELDLARKWRDHHDEKALHELIRSYMRLVVSISAKFKHYGLPMGDLIQEGNIGLMKAANKFDPDLNLRFSTYATWWVRASIQDFILRNWSIVRTGTTAAQKSLFFNLRRLRAQIKSADGLTQLDDQGRAKIAEELGVKVKDVEAMESRLSASDASLNAQISDSGQEEWKSLLSDEDAPTPEDVIIGTKDAHTRSQWLNEALGDLTDREKNIIEKRHLGDETVTLEVLGNELGISKERVRQLESRAMDKLRVSLSAHISQPEELI